MSLADITNALPLRWLGQRFRKGASELSVGARDTRIYSTGDPGEPPACPPERQDLYGFRLD